MKALILAAGFGTRLEASYLAYTGNHKEQLKTWAENKPKGLVIINGKPVIQYQLEQLLEAGLKVKDIFVHTNARYFPHYLAWATASGIPAQHVFNNGVWDHEHRLGSEGDLRYALERIERDGTLVMACDTLLFQEDNTVFPLSRMIQGYQRDRIARIVVYEGAKERLSQHGIVQVDEHETIIGFEEKPAVPKSNLVNASLHLYTKEMIESILHSSLPPLSESGMVIANLFSSFPIKVERAHRRVDIGTVDDVLQENMGEEK